mgnify:CR=1 FL=1
MQLMVMDVPEMLFTTTMKSPTEAVHDGGAMSCLVVDKVLELYEGMINAHGISIPLSRRPCHKKFKFGNDAVQAAKEFVLIPTAFGNQKGEILYGLPGWTPFLFSRPLMEELQLCVDYGKKIMRWGADRWMPVTQHQKNGHYVLDLLQDPSCLRRPACDFQYIPEDEKDN